jgi:NTP pyrophosphatase (non-canonical NTP hydrolase)
MGTDGAFMAQDYERQQSSALLAAEQANRIEAERERDEALVEVARLTSESATRPTQDPTVHAVAAETWRKRALAVLRAVDARERRQASVFAWAKSAFGEVQATSLPQRGLRLLEEAIEAYQACGGQRDQAFHLVGYVFSRPPGVLHQELGGVAVTTLCLAAAAGLSVDVEEEREVNRVLSKPIAEFTKRNEAKNAAGFLAVSDAKERK